MSTSKKKKDRDYNDNAEDFDPAIEKRAKHSNSKVIEFQSSRERKKLFQLNSQYSASERAKIQREDLKECYDELCLLMDLPIAVPFLEPVNYVKLQIWDYTEIIKYPMDLGTIKKLLVRNAIENPDHLYLYVKLVFDNARLYNKLDSQIHINSIKLWNQFSEKFSTMFVEEDATETIEIPKEENLEELYEKINSLKAEVGKLKDSREEVKGTIRRELNRRIRFTLPKMELTYTQKEEICKLIQELGEDDIPGLLQIIKSSDKGSADPNQSGEVEIDIERLDDNALVQIRRYIYDKTNPRHHTKRVQMQKMQGTQKRL